MDPATALPRKELETVTIRFCGDSGDGMQLTGAEFTRASAIAGNDLQTFPDYPAEIRAPAGTVAGVSGFQIQLGSTAIYTSGDRPDALVAMNPAALRANLADLAPGGLLVVNTGAFTPANLAKAGYQKDPLEDEEVQRRYRFVPVDISRLTAVALEGTGLSQKEVARARNMFALGLMLWLYGRPPEPTVRYLGNRFAKKPELAQANQKALEAGLAFGESTELFVERYRLRPARLEPGLYRNVSGNEATALGLLAAARLAGLPGFLGSYPITPASDILHELSRHKNFDFATFQAEDEIAACCAAIGAAYGARGYHHLRTRGGPQARSDRPRGDGRAAARHRQRAARRALHRTADEDRAGRPVPGGAGPQRGVAGAGARRLVAQRLLRVRDRGGAHRGAIDDAGDPALRRVHRERAGTLEGPGDARVVGHRRAFPQRLAAVPRLPPRRGAIRARLGPPGHAGAHAPHRWPGEGFPHGGRVLRPAEPRAYGARSRVQGGSHLGNVSAAAAERQSRRRGGGRGMGLHLRGNHPGRERAAREGPVRRQPAPAVPEPAPRRPGSDPAPSSYRARAGAEPGAA